MTVDTALMFADLGELAHEQDVLPDALDELGLRADLIGAGPLLDEWARRRVRRQRARRHWLSRRHGV